jgi:hypothetical protein
MKLLAENLHGTGVKRTNPVSRYLRKVRREQIVGAGTPFNWSVGYDSLSMIPPVNIKNQFQSDSCSGQAGSYFMEVLEKLANNQEGPISAKSIYAPIAVSGGGTYVSSLQKQLEASGASLEATVPSYRPNGTTDEPFMEDKTTLNPKDALIRAGYICVNVSIDMDSIASAIQQYGAVIWEIAGQNNGTWTSPNPQPPINGKNLWYHFMCSVGAGQPLGYKRIKSLQSWGIEVGERGIQYFNEAYINSGYVIDVFTFYKPVTVPTTETPAQISYWNMFWANVKSWRIWGWMKPLPYPNVPIGSVGSA